MSASEARPAVQSVSLLVGTRKGGFFVHGDGDRHIWRLEGPPFLGLMVNDLARDPRDGETVVLAAKAGHLGSTVYRGRWGASEWTEASRPPAFAKAANGESARAVDHVFCVVPGHADEPGVWYAGSSPVGVFRSEDGGDTWTGVSGFNDKLYPLHYAMFEDSSPVREPLLRICERTAIEVARQTLDAPAMPTLELL